MAEPRPSRLQKAKRDWPGIRSSREAIVGVITAVLAAVVELLIGSGGALDTIVVAVVAAVVAVVIVPAAQFTLLWVEAPMRLLTEDVIALRAEVHALSERVSHQVSATASVDEEPREEQLGRVRLTLLRFVQQAESIMGSGLVKRTDQQRWTEKVSDFLIAEVDPQIAEPFMQETAMTSQTAALRAIASAIDPYA
jgi:hypothetical protein